MYNQFEKYFIQRRCFKLSFFPNTIDYDGNVKANLPLVELL